jgi:hypothetical protein
LTQVRRFGADSTGWIGCSKTIENLATGDCGVMS